MLYLLVQEVDIMNTGKKIKLIRTFRGLTQKELGEACGIHEVAIRKYELGKNIPKPEQLRKIAEALNVNVNALAEFDIEADGDVIPLLFAIDEVFDISLKDADGEPGMFFNNKNLVQFLKDWQAMKELLASGQQTTDNYDIWKTIRPSVTKVVHED
jgi:transcriptional regulator with XRE-family HTH domain